MSRKFVIATVLIVVGVLLVPAQGVPADEAADQAALEKQRCPTPSDFAIVWSYGYGSEKVMPTDDAKFEAMVAKAKEGGFNTIHCTVSDKRLETCRKHGVKIMVDFLAEDAKQHVYKTVQDCEELGKKLRGNPAIWGYNLWNERFGKMGAGRNRDIVNVRKWDPTHPSYCGTYRTEQARYLANGDCPGYYDYHWARGTGQHFPNMLAFWNMAKTNNTLFGRWVEAAPGQPGNPGNVGRALYTANTSIACGLKCMIYFIATGYTEEDPKTHELKWTTSGEDIQKVNAEIAPLSKEVMKIGEPTAIYSTPITKDLNNNALPAAAMPPGLDNNKFPADFWIQPESGEFVLGVFKDNDKKDVIFVANHNAYAPQDVKLKIAKDVKASVFDRKEGKWMPLTVQDMAVSFKLIPGGGEMVRFE